MVSKQRLTSRDATSYIYAVLRALGIDNLNQSWLYIMYSLQLNIASCILQPIAFTTSYVMSSANMDIGTFLTSLQVAINVNIAIIKVIVMYFSMEKLREIDTLFDALDAKIHSDEGRAKRDEMAAFCKRLVIFYIIAYATYSTSTFLAALINGHPPYAIYIPYCHWEDSTAKMIIASFVEYYLINISCLQAVGADVYGIIFIYIARSHLQILCLRVEELGSDLTKSKNDNVETLIDCIDTHKMILELIEMVRTIISKTVFLQFIVTAAVMGTTLTNIMMYSNLYSGIGSTCFLLAVSLQTLPMCYIMNVFMDEINSLPTSIFHSQWFGQNKEFRRMMIFYMQNSQQFKNIIAGNIMPIQVATFVSIAKFAFSIYTLLHNMELRRSALFASEMDSGT